MTFNPNYYDPKTIADIVFPSQATGDLIHDLVSGAQPFPASGKNGILLHGVPGTGKSALAKLLPDAMELARSGELPNTMYVQVKQGNNGASVINQVASQSLLVPLSGNYHYFVLDEVDNLTEPAMRSLKSAMNSPNSIFILTTNYLKEVEIGVQNRCHRIAFNAAPPQLWLPLFRRVLTDMGVVIPPDSILLPIIAGCNGSAREVVSSAFQLGNRQKRLAAQTNGKSTQPAGQGALASTPVVNAGSSTP